MGNVYEAQGKYEQALEVYSKSLDIKIKVTGQDSPLVASTRNNIAIVYRKQGKYEEALEEYSKALDIRVSALGRAWTWPRRTATWGRCTVSKNNSRTPVL